MTETGMLLGNPYAGERRSETVGQPFPGVHVRLANADGSDAGAGAGSGLGGSHRGRGRGAGRKGAGGRMALGRAQLLSDGLRRRSPAQAILVLCIPCHPPALSAA